MKARTVIFGAFDRHNFGDMLFAHIVSTVLGQEHSSLFAGLAQRDLRPYSGHRTSGLNDILLEAGAGPIHLIHAGGELLSCPAWDAAVMLQSPPEAQAAISLYDRNVLDRAQWARNQLDTSRQAPYVVAATALPAGSRVIFNGVGGVDLAEQPAGLQHEVLAALRLADHVSVRDHITHSFLLQAGIDASLTPDPAARVMQLFSARIAHARQSAALQAIPPGDYVAVQFSADFADDATLDVLAQQLDKFCAASGLAIVLFRAGAAPWHDALEPYQRLQQRMRTGRIHIHENLDLWDICALLAGSKGYCGSSLHGRIVAMACGLPRVNLSRAPRNGQTGKQAAYAATWEVAGMPGTATPGQCASAMLQAMRIEGLQQAAAHWAEASRQDQMKWLELL